MKPILFSTPMVQAILAGRKTMTRRVVLEKMVDQWLEYDEWQSSVAPPGSVLGTPKNFFKGRARYQVGDVLWVRETWRENCMSMKENLIYDYKADPLQDDPDWIIGNWRPSIFMPKVAARIFLQVTDVRAERLQDITPHDAWLEGCRIGNSFVWEDHIPDLQQMCRDILFEKLWDSINEKRGYSWISNPFVWVYTFERCDKPEVE